MPKTCSVAMASPSAWAPSELGMHPDAAGSACAADVTWHVWSAEQARPRAAASRRAQQPWPLGSACRRVTAVHEDCIDVELKDGTRQSLPFGTCIWAAGVGMHPLVSAGGCAPGRSGMVC